MRRLLLIACCLLLALAGRAQELDSLQRAGLDSRLDAFFAALENESIPAKKAEADFLVGSCTTDAVRDYVAVRIYDHYLNSKRMGDEAVAFVPRGWNGETTADGLFTLNYVACLGCCSLAPVMMIRSSEGDETYGNLTKDKVQQILGEIRERA